MHALLKAGLDYYRIDVSPKLCRNLFEYISLLYKWNKTYSLTASKWPEAILRHHVLDSLSVYPWIQGQHCLDVGTGPGLPGLILAMTQTDKHWTLIDSSLKKVRFLRHVKAQLNINNVDIVQARAEQFKHEQGFSTIICRAFGSLLDFYEKCHHLGQTEGVLLAMKARPSGTELQAVRAKVARLDRIKLDLFDSDRDRCLVMLKLNTIS